MSIKRLSVQKRTPFPRQRRRNPWSVRHDLGKTLSVFKPFLARD